MTNVETCERSIMNFIFKDSENGKETIASIVFNKHKKKTRYSFRIPGFFYVYGVFPWLKVGNIRIAILASKVFPLEVPLIDLQSV